VMKKITKLMVAFLQDEEGATMVEYGLMVALIAIVAMVGASVLGKNVLNIFNEAGSAIGDPGSIGG